MFEQAIRPDTLARLNELVRDGMLQGTYLCGGTAVALHLGHRLSEDLDYFTEDEERIDEVYSYLIRRRAAILKKTGGSVTVTLEGVRVSFLTYRYPLLEATHDFRGSPVAGLLDLALMKIVAIADRGKRKDFIDLYGICHHGYSLHRILLDDMGRKFRGVNYSLVHHVKALTYFRDADAEEEPLVMLQPVDWEQVKSFFRDQVKGLNLSEG